jgi:hypothetical protein
LQTDRSDTILQQRLSQFHQVSDGSQAPQWQ